MKKSTYTKPLLEHWHFAIEGGFAVSTQFSDGGDLFEHLNQEED